MKLGPGSLPEGNRGRLMCATFVETPLLLTRHLFGRSCGRTPPRCSRGPRRSRRAGRRSRPSAGRLALSSPAPRSSAAVASRLVVGRFFSSRSAITVPYEPNRLSSSAGVSHPSKSVSTWRAVPFSGSIIGTRRSESSPTSNTTESQLAATIAGEKRSQAAAAEIRPRGRRWLGRRPRHLFVVGEPFHRQACEERLRRTQVVVLQVERRQVSSRPSRGRDAPGMPRSGGAWQPSRAGSPGTAGRSRGPAGRSPSGRAHGGPTSSSPSASTPRSAAYLRARSYSSHCSSTAVSLSPEASSTVVRIVVSRDTERMAATVRPA